MSDLPSWVPAQYVSLIDENAQANGVRPLLLAALLRQESGFNPNAISSSGAIGIAQFMPGTAASIGLQNPRDPTQAIPAAANFLSGLIKQFGGREDLGLAAYNAGAGSIVNGQIPQNGQTPNYVSSILSLAGGAQPDPSATGGSGSGLPSSYQVGGSVTLNGQVLGQALLDAVPELRDLAAKAASNNWDGTNTTAAIMNSTWWKTHSESYRQWQALYAADPRTASTVFAYAQDKAKRLGTELGVNLDDTGAKNLATMALFLGYTGQHDDGAVNDTLMRRFLVGAIKSDASGHYSGEAGSLQQQINEMARQYNVPLARGQIDYMVKSGMGTTLGDATQDKNMVQTNVVNWLKQQAKSLYPGLAKSIDGGMTVLSAASPYIATMAKSLEMPYDGSSQDQAEQMLNDPLVKQALQYTPTAKQGSTAAAGTTEPSTMPLWQFEQAVKQDPRWLKTANAQQSMMSASLQVLQDMGLTAAGSASSSAYGAQPGG